MRTQKQRRQSRKTDYKARLGMLKSELPRIVVRKTNKYLIVQAIKSDEAKDKVIKGITSKELLKNGWEKKFSGSLKSIPAGYLTGLLFAKKLGKEEFILDIGIIKNISGNRIYSVVKGLIDGGVNINVNEKIFPSEERLNGEHLKEELKSNIKQIKEKLKWMKMKED